jgi:L-seryl-tRNA(Ser) seleniumtransferase
VDLRELPSVDDLLTRYRGSLPRLLLAETIRETLDQTRLRIKAGDTFDIDGVMEDAISRARRASGVNVINATGVLLHTNLGRAAWSDDAVERGRAAASGPTDLELDLGTGSRHRRGSHVANLLRLLTGAEDALIVNNNAAAVLLSLAAVSQGRSVPVSRGELIEIGGSYRLPEVITASGARLVEVGTTNRTRVDDYRVALQIHDCGAVLRVHPSNYEISGFVENPLLKDLAGLTTDVGVPLIHDIGSGLLSRGAAWMPSPLPDWLADEPGANESLEDGADLVTFSGDKLLGGPQAGIIVGSSELIDLLRSHPMARALRVDAVTYAALAATLETYAEGDIERIPLWRSALTSASSLLARAEMIAGAVAGTVAPGHSTLGAGSAPTSRIPTSLVRLPGEDGMFQKLLDLDEPILARREDGALVLDPRTIPPERDQTVIRAILQCRS